MIEPNLGLSTPAVTMEAHSQVELKLLMLKLTGNAIPQETLSSLTIK